MIRFACPKCSVVMSVPESAAGGKGRCPKCKQLLIVPAPPRTQDQAMLGIRSPEQIRPGVPLPTPLPEEGLGHADTNGTPSVSSMPWTDTDDSPARMPPGTKIALIALPIGVLAIVFVGIAIAIKANQKNQTAERSAPVQSSTQVGRGSAPPPPDRRVIERSFTPRSDRDDDSTGIGFRLGAALVAFILYVVFWILLLAWVARDAKNRCIDGGAVWVMLVFFLSFIGLIIYMASRPHGGLTTCDKCHNRKLNYARICPHCGHSAD